MSYVDLQGLIDRFGNDELIQLTDTTGSGVVDAAVVNRAIADVDGEIDAYLVRRMTLPLATVPSALARLAASMVRYYLYRDAAPDLVKDQYDAAVKFLKAVAAGTASLGPDTAGGATPQTAAPSWSTPGRMFDDAGLRGL